mgnify:CR=1 FL=1
MWTLIQALEKFDANKIVFVEAESRKIGSLHVPDVLLETMRKSPCIKIQASIEARVEFLISDYDYFIQDPQHLISTIDYLKDLHSKETLARWKSLAQEGQWPTLVSELLEQHYDALYRRSQNSNYVNYETATSFNTADLSAKGIDILAKQMGTVGDTKRTDLMGMLLLISPPGYGKTTLMEYIAQRIGLIFVKINAFLL